MRTATTLARRHGSRTWELIHGPEVDCQAQRREVKAILRSKAHPVFAEISYYDGRSKHRTFAPVLTTPTLGGPDPSLPKVSPTPAKQKRKTARKRASRST